MPAWLVCDGIISKARDELLSQAVSVMHEQIEKKRISLEGHLPALKEGASESERDAFLLSQIVKEHENMEKRFRSYMEDARMGEDANSRGAELERFLLELKHMVLLHDYAKACESWLVEIEKELRETAPASILVKTMSRELIRGGVLDYLLKNKAFAKERLFSEEEKKIMEDALHRARG